MIVYRELASLVRDLGFSAHTLYYLSNNVDRHYHKVEIPKDNGDKRILHVPDSLLKSVQKRINEVLLPLMDVSQYAKAYRPGTSTVANVAPHCGREKILKMDIRKFFDHITYPQVREKIFPESIYSRNNSILLSMLCTYRDCLPQGAPTSPAISNIIMKDFDDALGEWCRDRKIRYTRYCDDLTFSGHFDAREVREHVRMQLRQMGFFVNDRKTVVAGQGQRMQVTGLTVNERIAVPRSYRRRLRQQLYYCRKYGLDSHMERARITLSGSEYLRSLLGKVNYVLSVTPDDREMIQYRQWLMKAGREKIE